MLQYFIEDQRREKRGLGLLGAKKRRCGVDHVFPRSKSAAVILPTYRTWSQLANPERLAVFSFSPDLHSGQNTPYAERLHVDRHTSVFARQLGFPDHDQRYAALSTSKAV